MALAWSDAERLSHCKHIKGIEDYNARYDEMHLQGGKTLRNYIAEYHRRAKGGQLLQVVESPGVDEVMLREMIASGLTEANINECQRFGKLKGTVGKAKAKAFFEGREGAKTPVFKVNVRVDRLLRRFILDGGFDIDEQVAEDDD